jgi:membrane protein DedA with SNARE-associated domain
MAEHLSEEKAISETNIPAKEEAVSKKSARRAYIIGIIGIALTVLMALAIIYFGNAVRQMAQYGYIGAFLISILGGATVIIPVPMLAIVFALGSVMQYPWLVALSAAAGELIGALTIYMTGQSAGRAISSKHGRIQRAYDKMLNLMVRRGALTLFIVTSVVNPFFNPAAFASGALR